MRGTMAALVAAMAVVCGQTQASQIYTFNTTTFGTNFGNPGLPLQVEYQLGDGVLGSGIAISGQNNGANSLPTYTGNLANFLSVNIRVGGSSSGYNFTPLSAPGRISTAVNIDGSGNITSGSLLFLGLYDEASITFGATTFSGLVGSDQSECNSSVQGVANHCFVSGTVTHSVPEPVSVAILGAGLIAYGAYRTKRPVETSQLYGAPS